jgi:hypothetical protein
MIARQDAEIRGGPPPQIAIVGSTRNTKDYAKTIHFMDELCEAELASKLVLEPLPPESIQRLIASQLNARFDEVDPALSSRVGSDCLGNPFYICQTIREWKLSQRVVFDGHRWSLSTEKSSDGESLPETVREALRSRLRRLPEGTAKTLSIAAAIGSNIDVDLLQAIAGQDNEFGFFDAIDDLLGREILRETGKPRVLAFAHDLLREASLSNLSATRRQGIHRVIGETLEKQQAAGKNVTDALLAEHFLAAHCNDKAFEYLLKGRQGAHQLREEGLRRLKELHTVLPEAEADPCRHAPAPQQEGRPPGRGGALVGSDFLRVAKSRTESNFDVPLSREWDLIDWELCLAHAPRNR